MRHGVFLLVRKKVQLRIRDLSIPTFAFVCGEIRKGVDRLALVKMMINLHLARAAQSAPFPDQ